MGSIKQIVQHVGISKTRFDIMNYVGIIRKIENNQAAILGVRYSFRKELILFAPYRIAD